MGWALLTALFSRFVLLWVPWGTHSFYVWYVGPTKGPIYYIAVGPTQGPTNRLAHRICFVF